MLYKNIIQIDVFIILESNLISYKIELMIHKSADLLVMKVCNHVK